MLAPVLLTLLVAQAAPPAAAPAPRPDPHARGQGAQKALRPAGAVERGDPPPRARPRGRRRRARPLLLVAGAVPDAEPGQGAGDDRALREAGPGQPDHAPQARGVPGADGKALAGPRSPAAGAEAERG